MLTREEDTDADALQKQRWTISAIARHLGRDRKTARAYLTGGRSPAFRSVRVRTASHRSATVCGLGWPRIRIRRS